MKNTEYRKNEDYLIWIRTLPCLACGRHGVEAHHVGKDWTNKMGVSLSGGTGMKPSDYVCLPLCPEHHRGSRGFHGLGWDRFEEEYGLILYREIIACLVKYQVEVLNHV